jgi:hypothetical protein
MFAGDWFVNGSDAHAGITLESGAGPLRVRLDVQWDGTGTIHTINESNNDTVMGGTHSTFYLVLSGTEEQAISPRGSDAITVTVTHMDDASLDARISGTATGDGPVTIAGTIRLRRNGPHAVKSTGAWANCDPVIHDKMAGAEDRSPSECEVKFDRHVREALRQALAPMVEGLRKDSWTVSTEANMGPATAMGRHTENAPYMLANAAEGGFSMELALDPGSEASQRMQQAQQQQLEQLGQKMADLVKSGRPDPKAIQQMTQSISGLMTNGRIEIAVRINSANAEAVNFKIGHTVKPLAGGGSVVFVPAAQPSSGGGADSAQAMTWVLIGPWGPVGGRNLGDGSEDVSASGGLSKAKPLLSVQNVWVKIQTSQQLAEQVNAKVDWARIRALVAEGGEGK